MEIVLSKFVLLYLLLPIVGLLLGGVMFFIAKKNQLLSDKKVIFYFLLTCVLLAAPGFLGFIHYWFMPNFFILLQVIYLLLGWWNLKIMRYFIKPIVEKPYYVEFSLSFVFMIVGAGLFSLIFNLSNELQYGLWAATCLLTFIFPSVFRKTYHLFMDIPLEVYAIWSYKNESEKVNSEYMDNNKIIVVELEIFKQVSDKEPLNIKAKASENMPFGIWFKLFIGDYNKKSPSAEVAFDDQKNSYGWMFYVNSSILGRKKYINPKLSFIANKIKEENIIIAKRAQYSQFGKQ